MDEQQITHLKGAVESLLFVSEKAVTIQQFKDAIAGSNANDIKKAIKILRQEYQERDAGMMIVEIANGFQMLSSSQYAEYIREFYKSTSKEKLSRPALETLAIIAYKQPVSRSDVEEIRGVNSDGVMSHLLNKGLIKIAGRKEVPGRPFLHGTTSKFLEYFGLKSIDDLPNLDEFPVLDEEQTIDTHTAKKEMVGDERSNLSMSEFEDDADVAHLAEKVQADFDHHDEHEEAIVHNREELKKAIEEMDEVELMGESSGQSRVGVDSHDESSLGDKE